MIALALYRLGNDSVMIFCYICQLPHNNLCLLQAWFGTIIHHMSYNCKHQNWQLYSVGVCLT
jgi:hypothetical protein